MESGGILCIMLILTLTGCQAADFRSGFWEYFSQLTNEKNGWNLQENAVREVTGLKNSLNSGASYVGNIFGPLKSGFQKRLYEDSDGLRRLIQREVHDLQRKIYPYMEEAHQKISTNLELLRNRLLPYTEELKYRVGWGTQELSMQFHLFKNDATNGVADKATQNIQDQISLHTGKMRQLLYPLAERLLAEIRHASEELHGNLAPHAFISQEKLTLQVQELSQKLTQNAKELNAKIHKNLDDLKEQLVSYPWEVREGSPDSQVAEPVAPYVEEMAAQVQREVEEFHRNTQMQIEEFTRTINTEMEEMKYKLSPASPDLQHTVTSIEEVQDKLESLWKDISKHLK
ncbi:apolipoprotein A-V [Pseudophryne corroboree]|uniref:apolipoprotein A-V n=1 Tax=Pseudophryne corroboree TaxID=495146 RepID=UPI003081E909